MRHCLRGFSRIDLVALMALGTALVGAIAPVIASGTGQAGMMISPSVLADNPFGAQVKPVGAGPYKVRSFESNVRTLMVRNDAYWGGINGRPAAFEHHFVPESRARLNALPWPNSHSDGPLPRMNDQCASSAACSSDATISSRCGCGAEPSAAAWWPSCQPAP